MIKLLWFVAVRQDLAPHIGEVQEQKRFCSVGRPAKVLEQRVWWERGGARALPFVEAGR